MMISSETEYKSGIMILDYSEGSDSFEFSQYISSELVQAESDLSVLESQIRETENTLRKLTPECDKLDYILSASSGVLCGIIDIFLVGKPGESPIGDFSDKWFAERTKDFAKLCNWDSTHDSTLHSAIEHLESRFKVPYDQTAPGQKAKDYLNLNTRNHHFKSLAHNPTLAGLFFSILDQFGETVRGEYRPTAHFIDNGKLIILSVQNNSFELRGKNIPAKLFCGFVNWFGHLISDMSGSSGSKCRGMGIPSPVWSWSNDIIAIKEKLKIPTLDFDTTINELALKMFREGYDARFQAAQLIPVFINEMIVRFFYGVRRAIRYYAVTEKENRSFGSMWKSCEPFSNATVKRMLTVAHGSFCLMDIGDAAIRSFATGAFNVNEFVVRLNIVGIGRFAVSLYGEVNRGVKRHEEKENVYFLGREKLIIENYIDGLLQLSEMYDDRLLLTFVDDLKNSDAYKTAFEKSVQLARKRNVPEQDILKSKPDIDNYFNGGAKNE